MLKNIASHLSRPSMKLDPAVIELLKLDPNTTSVGSAGGGGCSSASTSKITTTLEDGSKKEYFMKTGHGKDAEVMFEGRTSFSVFCQALTSPGEHASLSALYKSVPDLCPKSFGWGKFSSSASTSFLVTDFLSLTGRTRTTGDAPSLAAKLAKLHTTPAPTPDGYDQPQFGFPVTTCCGDTPQDNSFRSSWPDFYSNNRLRFILRQSERSNGKDAELHKLVEDTAAKVVPRLLGDNHLNGGRGITPVVVHGDLWSGNASAGVIGGRGVSQEVVYDPSAFYAHGEYELGIMRMFGGFGGDFLREYHKLCPKTDPMEEYEDRVALYEL